MAEREVWRFLTEQLVLLTGLKLLCTFIISTGKKQWEKLKITDVPNWKFGFSSDIPETLIGSQLQTCDCKLLSSISDIWSDKLQTCMNMNAGEAAYTLIISPWFIWSSNGTVKMSLICAFLESLVISIIPVLIVFIFMPFSNSPFRHFITTPLIQILL